MTPDEPGRIPVGRTWRDLPSTPPTTLRAMTPVRTDPPEATAAPRIGRFVVAGAIIVAVGFIIGILVPPPDLGADQTQGVSAAASTLPDLIIPTLPPESTIPDQGSVLPPSLSPSNPLFTLSRIPAGFDLVGNSVQVSPGRVDQVAVLVGGGIEIAIEAFTPSDAAEMPAGQAVTVREVDGVMSVGDVESTLAWIEPGDVQFSIRAPAEVEVDTLLEVADALEVS